MAACYDNNVNDLTVPHVILQVTEPLLSYRRRPPRFLAECRIVERSVG